MRNKYILLIFMVLLPCVALASSASQVKLDKATVNVRDKASLQRGAKIYINYCLGCHSLQYMRYNRMAEDIGLVDKQGNIYEGLLKNNLIFTGAKVSDTIENAMTEQEAKQWFGVLPPDLSLIARVRGADWLFTYLTSFYQDPKRPWGVNNVIFPDTAMPNVLLNLQGVQRPVYREQTQNLNGITQKLKEVDHLVLVNQGQMNTQQFESTVNDLVNFLVYVSEPVKVKRETIGYWVLGFLVLLAIVAYLLKREFWRDIKPKE